MKKFRKMADAQMIKKTLRSANESALKINVVKLQAAKE